MLFEYAIDPSTIIEWARDERSFQQFKKAFGHGQPRLLSNFPKRKKWRSLVKKLLSEDLGVLEQKRVEAILTTFRGQPVVLRDGPEYDGTECWRANILRQHDWVGFDHLFFAESTPCVEGVSFTVSDTFDDPTGCWEHRRQCLICRSAADFGTAIGNMLRLADRVIVVDPYFRAGHGQLAVMRELLNRLLTDRPHTAKPRLEIIYSLDGQGAPGPEVLAGAIIRAVPPELLEQFDLTVIAGTDTPMHNRYILTEHGGVSFGHSLSEDINTSDDVTLLEADNYFARWSEYAEHCLQGDFQRSSAGHEQ